MNRKLLFIVITATLGALIIVGGFTISDLVRNQLATNLVTQYSQQEAVAAQQVAHTLELEISQAEEKLVLIAQLPEVASGDEATCNTKLQQLVADPQIKLGNLGRVGPDGIFRCSVNTKLIGIKADTLGAYIDDIFNDPQHNPVMSRAIKPPGATSYVVAIHVPVWDSSGKFIGTIGGAVYLSDLEKQYLEKSPIAPGGYISLYDDDGTILYFYKPELIGLNIASQQFQQYLVGGSPPQQAIASIKSGASGTRQYIFDGDKKLSAFEPVHIFPGRTWRVSEVVPLSAVHGSIVTLGIDNLLTELPIALCALILFLFAFFIWTIIRRVFRPMEAIDKAKSDFVGIASHELRTPLGIIKWYIEAIKANDYMHTAPEKALDYINEIEKSNERLLDLVRNLLKVAHIDEKRTKDTPASVDVSQVIQESVREMKIEADKKEISITYVPPRSPLPKITIDQIRFKEVIDNLLSNAIKYSNQKGNVEITLESTTDKLSISVKDSGIGIPADAEHGMFTRFFRADNASRSSTQGNGLGLYVVKSYVQEWGGTIWYKSMENQGTTFFVTLPLPIKTKKA